MSTAQVDWRAPGVQEFLFQDWMERRRLARTDLLFLCNEVLGYKDVSRRVHGPILDRLQKFPGGVDNLTGFEGGLFNGTYAGYKPHAPIYNLDGISRNTMVLWPRGGLKTTVITIAHSIQWIINYPDIRICFSSATGSQVRGFLDETKKHFQFNETFRYLFPEFCPQPAEKAWDFGNQDEFTVPARKTHRKEPTVNIITVGSVVAGDHYEVLKNDDLVDKENVRTPEGIRTVKEHVAALGPLVERFNSDLVDPDVLGRVGQKGWVDIAGTCYSYSDLYSMICDEEAKKPQAKRQWSILRQSAVVRGASPYAPDAESYWPERLSLKDMQQIIENPAEGPVSFAAQYLQNPIIDSEGLVKSKADIRWIPVSAIREMYPGMPLCVTVDLAGMEPNAHGDNDYTVLNLHGYGLDGTLYFIEIRHGRFDPHQVIEHMFELWKHHPRIRWFKIEKEAHSRVLLPFLKAEMARRGIFLPIQELKRDSRVSKYHRIRGLQALFQAGRIAFAGTETEAIQRVRGAIAPETRHHIETEIMRFPRYAHDDILDTMADALQDYQGNVTSDVLPRMRGDVPAGWLDGPGEKVVPTFPVINEHLAAQLHGEEEESRKYDVHTGM